MGMFDEEPEAPPVEPTPVETPPVQDPPTTPVVDPFAKLTEENSQLRQQVTQLSQQFNQFMWQSTQRQEAPKPPPDPEPEIDFSTDPRAAIETLAERKARRLYESEVVPIIKQFQQSQQERAVADARAQYEAIKADPTTAPFYEQYRTEFDDALKTLSEKDFNAISRPGAVKQVFNFVLGQHIDTILKGSARPNGMAQAAPPIATKAIPKAASTKPQPPSRLSDDEARMAASFGMSPEEWSKWANNPEGV